MPPPLHTQTLSFCSKPRRPGLGSRLFSSLLWAGQFMPHWASISIFVGEDKTICGPDCENQLQNARSAQSPAPASVRWRPLLQLLRRHSSLSFHHPGHPSLDICPFALTPVRGSRCSAQRYTPFLVPETALLLVSPEAESPGFPTPVLSCLVLSMTLTFNAMLVGFTCISPPPTQWGSMRAKGLLQHSEPCLAHPGI